MYPTPSMRGGTSRGITTVKQSSELSSASSSPASAYEDRSQSSSRTATETHVSEFSMFRELRAWRGACRLT